MRKFIRNIKNKETGAISTLVLFTILMFIVILMGTYLTITTMQKSQLKSDLRIQEVYGQEVNEVDEIYLEQEAIIHSGWNKEKKVNTPQVLTGMTPIKFTDPTETTEGTTVTTTSTDVNWYNYEVGNWANSQTQDGSMWVWIPRYAYKITYYTDENKTTVSSSKTSYGSVDVVFLIGTTDTYYDENGAIKTAQRQKTVDQTIDTTKDFTVHPAFTNESSINYANGGWRKELTGIWVAKFEAGYASGNNSAPIKASRVYYTEPRSWVAATETSAESDSRQVARNWLDGVYSKVDENGTMTYGSTKYSWINGEVAIKYPTFQGLTYSMNYINQNDSYNIARALTESGNIYGLSNSNADSHLMKNSEWGAVSYLSQSKYGLDGTNIYINNVTLDSSTTSVYAVTGMAGSSEDAGKVITTIDAINNKTTNNVYTWKEANGTKASSTGTIYGIYDLSGGLWERTASFAYNGHSNLNNFGSSLLNNGVSTEYVSIYPSNDSGITVLDTANQNNYEVNTKIYGDAVRETSIGGTGSTSWYKDYSYFPGYTHPFFVRGGRWDSTSSAGLFHFYRDDGTNIYRNGFRAVLVAQ